MMCYRKIAVAITMLAVSLVVVVVVNAPAAEAPGARINAETPLGNPSFEELSSSTHSDRARRGQVNEDLDTYGIMKWIAGTTFLHYSGGRQRGFQAAPKATLV